jgi:NADH-quinone oxidoreductase subunit A
LLTGFGSVALFLVIALLFSITMILIPLMLRTVGVVPKKPNPVKNSNFECGMQTIGKTWVRFNFRYYFYALLFVALDVMVVFIYPWATRLRQLGYFSLAVIVIFIALIVFGYIYAWKKKVLEWK